MLKEFFQEQKIIEFLKSHYGIAVQSAQILPLGADMNAVVYKANSESKSYFVKLKYDHHDEIHISIIRFLHDSEIKEIIFPICAMDKKLFQKIERYKMIVYPFIDGQDGFNQKLTKNQWLQLGKALKKIHTLSVPVSIQKQLRKETYSTKWRETVRSLYPKIGSHESNDKVTADFKTFFQRNIDVIHQLVDAAEKLSKKIQHNSNNDVLCHSDIHAGNVLIAADASLHIIDWDDPMMAPKERDLMFIGGGVGNVWNTPYEIGYFYEGYGETNIDETILSYYRHERIVEDIALYGQDLLSHDQCDQSKSVSFKHFKSMFEPNGVIEIALTQ